LSSKVFQFPTGESLSAAVMSKGTPQITSNSPRIIQLIK
jgi:hypothetical protein